MNLNIRGLKFELAWSRRFRPQQKSYHAHSLNGKTAWFRDVPLASGGCYPGPVIATAEVSHVA